jgi:hypothetical protein
LDPVGLVGSEDYGWYERGKSHKEWISVKVEIEVEGLESGFNGQLMVSASYGRGLKVVCISITCMNICNILAIPVHKFTQQEFEVDSLDFAIT